MVIVRRLVIIICFSIFLHISRFLTIVSTVVDFYFICICIADGIESYECTYHKAHTDRWTEDEHGVMCSTISCPCLFLFVVPQTVQQQTLLDIHYLFAVMFHVKSMPRIMRRYLIQGKSLQTLRKSSVVEPSI